MKNGTLKRIRSSLVLLQFCCNALITILNAQTDTINDKPGDSCLYLMSDKINKIESSRLQFMPFRSIFGTALSSPNTYYLKYDRLYVDGLEATGDFIFIDGMQVSDGNDFPIRSIGTFQHYRMNQPIQFGNVAGSLIEINTAEHPDKFHFDLDGYTTIEKERIKNRTIKKRLNNNVVELNIGGPFRFSKAAKSKKKVPVFYFASNYTFTNDPNPSCENKYAVTDDKQSSITENPLLPSGLSGGGTFLSAEFLGQNDIEEVRSHQNADRKSSYTFLKLMLPLTKNINLTLGSYIKFDWGKEYVFENAMLNYQNNPETFYRNFDNYLNFEHKFNLSEDLKIGYNVNLQYSNYYFRRQDPRHKDRYFEYGYLGKYTTSKIPTYELRDEIIIDGVTYENVYVLNSWDFDTAYTFQNLNINPERARFTEQIYELFPTNWEEGSTSGNWSNSNNLQMRGGLLNGDNPESVYYFWNSQGEMMNNYGYSEKEKFRGAVQIDADYKSHHFFAGVEYLNIVERSFTINPMNLWGKMRGIINFHLRELDIENPQLDQLASDNIIYYYRKYDEISQFDFDKNLREKLGLPVDGTDFILTDSYDMMNNTITYYDKNGVMQTISVPANLFSLDMFSPSELLNDGNYIVNAQGYDYTGNKLKGKQSEYSFFDNYLVNAYRPTYFSVHLGDNFKWKMLDISIGLRIDNFNANQPKLKDPFLLYPAKTVDETTNLGGTPVSHPENMGSDYVVYVDNVSAPTEITGYRNEFTWFNAEGVEIQDPNQLDRGSGISPYLKNPNQISVDQYVFESYNGVTSILPQVNLNMPINKYGEVYFDFNSFSQNPTAYHTFNPSQYYYIYYASGMVNNPALNPMKIYKANIGIRPRIYKTLFADVSYLQVFIKNYNYLDTLTGAYPVDYITILNKEDLIRTQNLTASINYFSPKSSGIAAGSSLTKTFISVEDRNYMNISDLVWNTHLTFNFGSGKEFVLNDNKTLRGFFENFGIGIFHQYRKGTELPVAAIYLNSSVTNLTRNYSYSPDIDILNLRVEKGFYMPRLGLTASIYLWIENLFDKQNLFYINTETGKPDDDGYLSDPMWQNEINSQTNPDTYRMLYQYKLMNPEYYDKPRIIRAGIIIKV